jgi:hypothetical protein
MGSSVTVTFNQDQWLPVTRDGLDYQIHYSYVSSDLVGQPEEETETKSGTVLVGISRTLSSMWNLEGENLQRVLFEYAKRHIAAKAEEGSLGGHSELQLTTASAPGECPFNPARIHLDFNKPFQFEIPNSNPIAIAESTALPSQIIDLRDSINAIYGENFGGRLLTLPQERHIIELHKECKGHEDFAYRVASLGGLAIAISTEDLKRNLAQAQTSIQSNHPLDLLGTFLRSRCPKDQVNQIMDSLKSFNHLRRLYPVHSDRAKGVLAAHRFFNLDYPVRDHGASWRRLLEVYRDTLEKLLALLKT